MAIEGGALVSQALVFAQADMEQPNKDREVEVQMKKADGTPGGKYKFRYATLGNTIATIRPALTAQDLGFIQRVIDGQMVTRLVHASGEYIDCGVPMPPLPAKPQDAGAIISYYRRFSLTTALGIVADEDDEKNVAIEHDAAPGPAWPDGPYTSKSGLKAAWKAMVRDLHGAGSPQEVEDIIDRDKDMLAQFRAAARNNVDDLRAQYQGHGDFNGVATELANARAKWASLTDAPRDPGPPAALPVIEMAETTQVLLKLLKLCTTGQQLTDWSDGNKEVIEAASDDDKEALRKALTERKAELRAARTLPKAA